MTLMAANRTFGGFTSLSSSAGTTGDLELSLELGNAPAGGQEFGVLAARQTGLESAIDAVLLPPVVDRLAADPEVPGDVGDLAACVDQVEDPAPEFRWITSSSRPVLFVQVTQESNNETLSNWGKTTRFLESRPP